MTEQPPQKNLKKRALRSMGAWGGLQIVQRFIAFASRILLYRLLAAKDFGIFSLFELALTLILLAQDLGIQDVLIQRKDSDPTYPDFFATAYRIRVAASVLCTFLILTGADLISNFLKHPEIAQPLRVASVSLWVALLIFPFEVYIQKTISFEGFIRPNLTAQFSSMVIAVALAWAGWGHWALIISGLISQIFRYLVFQFSVRVPYKGKWNSRLIPALTVQSGQMLTIAVISFCGIQMLQAFVAKYFDLAGVGFFYLAFNWANFAVVYVVQHTARIMFPAMAEIQQDKPRILKAYSGYLRWTSLIAAAYSVLLALFAPDIIPFLIGAKWNTAIPLCQVLCFYGFFRAISTPNLTVLQSLGCYKQVCWIRGTELAFFFLLFHPVATRYGLFSISILLVISRFMGWCLSLRQTAKALKFSTWQLFAVHIPSVASTAIAGVLVLGFRVWTAEQTSLAAVYGWLEFLIGTSVLLAVYFKWDPAGFAQAKELLSHLTQKLQSLRARKSPPV